MGRAGERELELFLIQHPCHWDINLSESELVSLNEEHFV